mmetsp:Transcript_28144/g.49885  ORF Transcript_28144/g.49885 Transcript_28144/m.49885 type:complete len:568 (+) Transcript_28144:74-1777(+)
MPVGRENAPSCLGEIAGKIEPKIGKISAAGRCHRPPRTLASDFEVSSTVLGSGYAGQVRLAFKKGLDSKQQVAVKSFKLRGMKTSKKTQLTNEIGVFLCMDHPHVARLLDVYETNTEMHLVMECMEGGELFSRVTEVKKFSEFDAADATRQMLLSLHYVHSYGIVHRDLKLENFLYDVKGGNHLKMIDFGFSKFFDSKGGRLKTSCGTMAYVAPEVLGKGGYTSQCDLWSMGVIVFVLLSGRMPFRGKSEEQARDIKKGNYSFKNEHWGNISAVAMEFTRSLLEPNPAKRLTSKQALQHRWILGYSKKAAPTWDLVPIFDALRSWELAPKFQRVCHSMMAWSITNEHHAQVRDYFLALDKNHDGFISLGELQGVLVQELNMSEPEASEALQVLWRHGDQKISYSEFLAAMLYSNDDDVNLAVDDDVLRSAFMNFDTDASGYIETNDLKHLLGERFEGEIVEEFVTVVKDLDFEDHDIETCVLENKFNFQEFSQYARSHKPAVSGLPKIASAAREAASGQCLSSDQAPLFAVGSGSQNQLAQAMDAEPEEISLSNVWQQQPACKCLVQ